jgi:hypothetical protein
MTRRIFTSNITWLILGAMSFFIGRVLTDVPRTPSGMLDDKMLPFTFMALLNFIMGAYVQAKYKETGKDQKLMMRAVNMSSIGICLLLVSWAVKMYIQ